MATQQNSVEGRGWRSWKLKLWCTVTIVVCQFAALATIIALTVVSKLSDGFASVSDGPLSTVAGRVDPRHLLWTSLPTFLLVLLNTIYAMIVNSSAERQPYVELVGTPKRSNAKMTILLDYPSYPPFYNWIVAFRNGHHHLGTAMLVFLLGNLSLVPLTSGLFRPEGTFVPSEIDLQGINMVNFRTLSLQTSLQPAIDLAAAIRAYGAQQPTWMTNQYAFDPFVPVEAPEVSTITAETSSYHVEPQCEVIELAPNSTAGNSSAFGTTSLHFIDRECRVDTSQWPIAPARKSFTYAWYQPCSDSVLPVDRIGVFAGLYSANALGGLANQTIISCMPKYFRTTVNLTMEFDTDGARRFVNMSAGPSSRMRLLNLRTINSNLPFYKLEDMSGDFKSDTFGNAVHSYAANLSPASEFQAGIYREATEEMYTTMFAALANTQLMQSRPAIVTSSGLQTTVKIHVYVSIPIAVVLCTLLCCMIGCTIGLIVHVETHSAILKDEPVGLLGRALVLLRSDVMDFAEQLEKEHPEGQYIAQVNQNYSWANSECWLGEEDDGRGRVIRVEKLEEIEPEYTVLPAWERPFSASTPARKREKKVNRARKKAKRAARNDAKMEAKRRATAAKNASKKPAAQDVRRDQGNGPDRIDAV